MTARPGGGGTFAGCGAVSGCGCGGRRRRKGKGQAARRRRCARRFACNNGRRCHFFFCDKRVHERVFCRGRRHQGPNGAAAAQHSDGEGPCERDCRRVCRRRSRRAQKPRVERVDHSEQRHCGPAARALGGDEKGQPCVRRLARRNPRRGADPHKHAQHARDKVRRPGKGVQRRADRVPGGGQGASGAPVQGCAARARRRRDPRDCGERRRAGLRVGDSREGPPREGPRGAPLCREQAQRHCAAQGVHRRAPPDVPRHGNPRSGTGRACQPHRGELQQGRRIHRKSGRRAPQGKQAPAQEPQEDVLSHRPHLCDPRCRGCAELHSRVNLLTCFPPKAHKAFETKQAILFPRFARDFET